MGTAIQHLNILAVLLGTVAYFALGAIWYSPFLFSKQWAELNKIDTTDRSGMMRSMVIGAACMLVMVTVTGVIMNLTRYRQYIGGLEVGVLLAGAYAGGILGVTYAFTRRPLALWFIDGGYHFLGILIASAIIAAM